ncbi:MAG: O-antigen ligase family protein [Terriglobales bacterium]|jgi:O-antigen ligase
MQTQELQVPTGNRAAAKARFHLDKSTITGLLAFAALGFLIIFGLSWVVWRFSRHGSLIAVAIVIVIPVGAAATIVAAPQLYHRLGVLWSKLRWWHALWALLYISTLVFRVRSQEATQAEPLDAWTLVRIGPEGIVGLWLLVRLYHRPDAVTWFRWMFRGLTGWLTVFALVCITSTLWSVYPPWTLYKSLEYFLDISVLAAALANIHSLTDYEDLFNWTWAIFGVELLWVWLQVPLWPSESLADSRLKGFIPATGSNAVGQSGAIFAIIALCRLLPLNRKRSNISFSLVLFVFGILSLLISQTRNAVGAFGLGLILILFLSRRKWMAVMMGVLGAVAWFFTPLGDIALAYLQREQSAGAIESLSGRAAFWAYAWEQFLLHPITGMGAYAGGRFYVMTKLGIDPTSLHSDWVELLVGVGLMGLIPFCCALIGTWYFLIRGVYDRTLDSRGRQMAYEAAGVVAVITVHSFFNVELIWHVPLFLFVLLGYAEMLRRRGKVVPPRPLPPLFTRSAPEFARAPSAQ